MDINKRNDVLNVIRMLIDSGVSIYQLNVDMVVEAIIRICNERGINCIVTDNTKRDIINPLIQTLKMRARHNRNNIDNLFSNLSLNNHDNNDIDNQFSNMHI